MTALASLALCGAPLLPPAPPLTPLARAADRPDKKLPVTPLKKPAVTVLDAAAAAVAAAALAGVARPGLPGIPTARALVPGSGRSDTRIGGGGRATALDAMGAPADAPVVVDEPLPLIALELRGTALSALAVNWATSLMGKYANRRAGGAVTSRLGCSVPPSRPLRLQEPGTDRCAAPPPLRRAAAVSVRGASPCEFAVPPTHASGRRSCSEKSRPNKEPMRPSAAVACAASNGSNTAQSSASTYATPSAPHACHARSEHVSTLPRPSSRWEVMSARKGGRAPDLADQ